LAFYFHVLYTICYCETHHLLPLDLPAHTHTHTHTHTYMCVCVCVCVCVHIDICTSIAAGREEIKRSTYACSEISYWY